MGAMDRDYWREPQNKNQKKNRLKGLNEKSKLEKHINKSNKILNIRLKQNDNILPKLTIFTIAVIATVLIIAFNN